MTPKNTLHYREQRAAYWQQVAETVVSPFKRRLKRATSFTMAVLIVATNLFLIQLFTASKPVQAATAGPEEVSASGDCVNDNGTGTVAWTNPGNAFSNNATYASVSVDGTTSNYIKCTNFGFSIPSGTTIDGIVVSVERKSDSTGNGGSKDAAVRVVKAGVIGTTDRSTATIYTTGDVTEDHGGVTDLWGTSWTHTDINATNFGAAFAATKASAAGAAHSVTVDVITITVYYTLNPVFDQSSYRWFNNQDATFGLVETWGGGGQDSARDSVIDSSNNIYVVGETNSVGLTGANNDQTLVKYNSSGVEQWSKTWGGDGLSAAYGVALDSSGNIYVVGYTNSTGFTAGNQDQTLVKYNSSGVEQWSKTWGGTANDFAYDVALDSSGNIYVVGDTSSTGFTAGSTDQTLVKYNSSGVEQWSKTWGGTGSETARDLVLDSSGNIFVTGQTSTTGFTAGGNDQTLVKYDSSGVEQWSKTWGGDGNDSGWAVSLDASGNIYVAGDTTSTGFTAGGNDQTLVKYNSSGVEQWSKTWGGTGIDTAYAMAIDTSNNIYVGGYTESTGFTAGSGDQTLVKYDSSGVEQWSKTWGDSSSEIAFSVNISTTGTIITAGTVTSTTFSVGSVDQSLLIFSSTGTIDNCSSCVDRATSETDRATTETDRATSETDRATTETDRTATEVNRDAPQILVHCGAVTGYLNTWGGTSADVANDVVIDASGNLFVVGESSSSGLTAGNYDLTLVKYNSSGVEQWSKTLGDTAYQTGQAIALDTSGNIYVGGDSATSGTSDIFITKFDSSGVEQWSKTWGGSGSEGVRGLTLDSSNNIYITGYTNSTGFTAGVGDVLLMKFDSSGVEQWTKTWGGTAEDAGFAVKLDGSGNIYVAGYTSSTGFTAGGNDQLLMKFNSSGVEQWTKTLGGTGTDEARGLAVDSSGNIFTVGYSTSTGYTSGAGDVLLSKFNSSGVEQWTKSWGNSGTNEIGYSIELDSSGNIYVSGEGNSEHILAKFDSSGIEQWGVFWGGSGTNEKSWGLAVDSSNNPYAVGQTDSANFTTGGFEQELFKLDKDALYCHGVCTAYAITEVDRTVTETDRATSEVDRTVTETDRAMTETDRTMSEVYRNENTGAVTMDVSTPLNSVAQNTATTAPAEGSPFRLRATLHVSTGDAPASSGAFKLQVAVKSGTCDTSFTGESYYDVSTTTPIAYYDNPKASDGLGLAANANDPVHSGHSNVLQQYNESGNIDIANAITAGSDGLWDLALVDNGAPANTSYCFRIVTSAGSVLSAYTVVPEITTASTQFEQSGYRWFDGDTTVTSSFAQSWGGDAADTAYAVVRTSDGGFAVAGASASTGLTAGSNDQTIVKYNSSGVEQWSKTWGGTDIDIAYDIIESSDGGLVVVGVTQSTGLTSDFEDQTIVKYNSSGVEQWSKTWGGDGSDYAYGVIESSDGGFVVVGITNSTGYTSGGTDQTLVKYNSSGVEQWSKTWGGDATDQANELVETSDGGFVVVGTTTSTGLTAGLQDQTLVKYNSSGVEQWSKTWGGDAADFAYSVIESSDGGLIVAGTSASTGLTAGSNDQTLVKYNSSGVEQWSKTWGGTGSDTAQEVVEISDGSLIVAGNTASTGFTAGSNDQTLVKYNSSGVEQWSKTWGGTGSELGYGLVVASDSGPVMIGSAASTEFVTGSSDQTMLKFFSDGTISNCSSCVDRTASETDRSATETDRAMTEVNRTATEVDRSTSEANRDVPFVIVHCGIADGMLKIAGSSGQTDVAHSIQATSDGGYIIVGVGGASSTEQVIIKYNSSGTRQWSKTWGGTSTETARGVIETSDGGFAVVGETNSAGFTAGGNDQTLVKYNSSGVEQWSKTWGGDSSDVAYSVIETSDGGFAVAGSTSSTGFTAGSNDQTLVKYNSSGVEQWSKTWGGTSTDIAYDLVETSDGGFAVVGETSSTGFTAGGVDQTLVKYNSSGVEQWSKTWGGTSSDAARSVIELSDGSLVVAGYTASTGFTNGGNDQTLVKYNSSGVEQWSKTLGGDLNDTVYDMALTSDGGFVVVGTTTSTGLSHGLSAQMAVKYNSSGVEQWTKTWGGSTGTEDARSVTVLSDGTVLVVGYSSSTGITQVSNNDMTIFTIDSRGTACSGLCNDRSLDETDRATSETDRTATETDRATSETDRATSEADYTPTEATRNESLVEVSVPVGSPLAAADTAASLARSDNYMRLRMLTHITNKAAAASTSPSLKLQVAPRIGTCDTGFSGETYSDITSSSLISYYDVSGYDNGIALSHTFSTDPSHSAHSVSLQSFVESSPFSVIRRGATGTDALWDFSLTSSGTSGGYYCVRIVENSGSTLTSYSQVPQIFIPPSTGQFMRHGSYFDTSTEAAVKQAFYW